MLTAIILVLSHTHTNNNKHTNLPAAGCLERWPCPITSGGVITLATSEAATPP